jgi:uncharacterized Tic20 family protein
MTSNPSRPTPEWPAPGPAQSEPLGALPAARWPTTRAPWPGPGVAQAAQSPQPATGEPTAPAQAAAESAAPASPPDAPDAPSPADAGDERLATLSYLGVPFLGPLVPLAIFLFKGRSSAYTRRHAAQALDLAITTLLYSVCAVILGTMLALDNIVLALVVVVPLVVALWLVTLAYVIVAGSSANRGDYYPIPSWICASLTH